MLANLAPSHRTMLIGEEEDEGVDDDAELATRARR